jgi:peroxiredoxin
VKGTSEGYEVSNSNTFKDMQYWDHEMTMLDGVEMCADNKCTVTKETNNMET